MKVGLVVEERIQGSFFKKIMLGKIISAVCKLDLSPQTMLLIFFP